METVEVTETLFCVPEEGGTWIFGGNPSGLMKRVFTDNWAEHFEEPLQFWAEILQDLEGQKLAAEVTLDMEYDFGVVADLEEVNDYMESHQEGGYRYLSVCLVSLVMVSARLRGFQIRDIEVI